MFTKIATILCHIVVLYIIKGFPFIVLIMNIPENIRVLFILKLVFRIGFIT